MTLATTDSHKIKLPADTLGNPEGIPSTAFVVARSTDLKVSRLTSVMRMLPPDQLKIEPITTTA